MASARLIEELRESGVLLGIEGHDIRIKWPPGVKNDALRRAIQQYKPDIIELLKARPRDNSDDEGQLPAAHKAERGIASESELDVLSAAESPPQPCVKCCEVCRGINWGRICILCLKPCPVGKTAKLRHGDVWIVRPWYVPSVDRVISFQTPKAHIVWIVDNTSSPFPSPNNLSPQCHLSRLVRHQGDSSRSFWRFLIPIPTRTSAVM